MFSKKHLIIKRAVPAALAVFLCLGGPRAWAYDDLLIPEEGAVKTVNYTTTTVYRGDFITTGSETGQAYYPTTYDLKFENNDARFVEYKVGNNAEVKAGDVLAEFIVEGGSVEVKRLELQVTRTQEETERGIRDREEQLTETKKNRAKATGYGWERLNLEVKRQNVELERYKLQQERKLEQTQKELEEAREMAANVLVAPADGVVTYRCPKSPNDPINADEVLITICSRDVVLLAVNNTVNDGKVVFRYNMPVVIRSGEGMTGRVVASSDLVLGEYGVLGVSEDANRNKVGALIEVDVPEGEEFPAGCGVLAETACELDVLLVNRMALNAEGDQFYVNKLSEDGVVQKRYVNVVWDRNLTDAWVLDGLSEGDVVIMD